MKGERVTLADIAEEVGCAKSTVSMALRGNHMIPPSTREKIAQVCKRLGYRPNPLLASLASHRFRSTKKVFDIPLGFIVSESSAVKEMESLKLAQRHAPSLGYKVTAYMAKELAAQREPGRVLYNRGIQGIILPNFFDPVSLPQMDWSLFSVVTLGHPLQVDSIWAETGFHRVTTDHYESMTAAWKRARKSGYKRIGVVLYAHEIPIRDDELRRAAWLYCQQETPIRDRIPLVEKVFEEPYDLKPWLNRHRPDVVIGMTPHVYWKICQAGRRIPKDVAFITLHKSEPEDYEENKFMAGMVDLTKSEIPVALEILDQEVRLRYRGVSKLPRTVLLHPRWIDAKSMPLRLDPNKT